MSPGQCTGDWRRLTRSFSADRWGYDRWWGIDSMCTLSFISLSRICTSCCMEGRWPDSSLDHTGTSSTEHTREKSTVTLRASGNRQSWCKMELRSSRKLCELELICVEQNIWINASNIWLCWTPAQIGEQCLVYHIDGEVQNIHWHSSQLEKSTLLSPSSDNLVLVTDSLVFQG